MAYDYDDYYRCGHPAADISVGPANPQPDRECPLRKKPLLVQLEAADARERAEYERLKAKFESGKQNG
jgi:hypothetical protein